MNRKLVSPTIAAAFLLALGANASLSAPESAASQPFTFFCNDSGPTPVTAIRLNSDAEGEKVHSVLTWEAQHFSDAERACRQAAGRLQAFASESDPNDFNYTMGELSGLPVICLEAELTDGCSDRVLISLEEGQDPKVVLKSMTGQEVTAPVATRGDFPISIQAFPFPIPFF